MAEWQRGRDISKGTIYGPGSKNSVEDSRYLGYLGFQRSVQDSLRQRQIAKYARGSAGRTVCTGLHWYALARKLVLFPLKPPGGSGGG